MHDVVKRPLNKVGRVNDAKGLTVGGARLLTEKEVELARHKRGKDPAVKRFRDSHHMMARLFAMGLRTSVIAEQTGYSLTRVGMLKSDPAFQELIAHYRGKVDEGYEGIATDYFGIINKGRTQAARMIVDK